MITIYVKEIDGSWFGLAYTGKEIAATAINSVKARAIEITGTTVIPEFSAVTILSLLITISPAAVIVSKKKMLN